MTRLIVALAGVVLLASCANSHSRIGVLNADGSRLDYYNSKDVNVSAKQAPDGAWSFDLTGDASTPIGAKGQAAADTIEASGDIAGEFFAAGFQAAQSYFGSQLQANSVEIDALKEQNKRLERELKALRQPEPEPAPEVE